MSKSTQTTESDKAINNPSNEPWWPWIANDFNLESDRLKRGTGLESNRLKPLPSLSEVLQPTGLVVAPTANHKPWSYLK